MLLRQEVQRIQCLSLRLGDGRDVSRAREAEEASVRAARVLEYHPLGVVCRGRLVVEQRAEGVTFAVFSEPTEGASAGWSHT